MALGGLEVTDSDGDTLRMEEFPNDTTEVLLSVMEDGGESSLLLDRDNAVVVCEWLADYFDFSPPTANPA